MKKFLLTLAVFTTACLATAQAQDTANNMGDMLMGHGKFIAVIVVLTIILLGLAVFLVSMDRRISQLEKESDK